jgi:anti-sigma factor RsiW
MNEHLTAEEVEEYAAGELDDDRARTAGAHIRTCAACANDVLAVMQMKSAMRAIPRAQPPSSLRVLAAPPARRTTRASWWLAAAAVLALAIAGLGVFRARVVASGELIDLHNTIIASANPVDVLSTDKHTVKPWFEGKLPFAVPVPDLASTEFRLLGGRVVYWRGQPGAYLLVGKAAHRISVFVFAADSIPLPALSNRAATVVSWHDRGLAFFAIGSIPAGDLQSLERAFQRTADAHPVGAPQRSETE